MKRFEFHLDGLLRVKRQLEHLAQLEHQKAERRVGECAARVKHLKDLLAKASDGMAAKVGQAMAAGEWAAAFARAERLGHQIGLRPTNCGRLSYSWKARTERRCG